MSSRTRTLGLAAAFALACTPVLAQPAMRDHRGGPGVRDHRLPPPPPPPGVPAAVGPTAAPPPPQAEHPGNRAGFVWITGRWDWKAGKWAWVPGHWERERAGRQWHEGRWEQHGSRWAWVDGEWIAAAEPAVAGTPPPPPPDTEPPVVRDHRHEWKLDRPFVSSYWPNRVKVGTLVVIRGGNFPPDSEVMWGEAPIKAASIADQKIAFRVPAGAVSGELRVRHTHGPALDVGPIEVVTTGDPDADLKRQREAERKAAEEAWAARQHELAKDRAAREAAWQKHEDERERTREQRRAQREQEIRAKWEAAFLDDPQTQAELTLHAQRVAQLERAKEIAEVKDDGKLAIRIDVATSRENDRHHQRMAALKAAFAQGGHP